MKLLITGATGFIGSRLTLQARREGWEVVATGMTNTTAEHGRLAALEAAGVAVRIGALQDRQFSHNIAAGCDVVIHLAAAQHEANVPESYFREVNVEGTRCLLEASGAVGVGRFVYGSTIGVYGAAGRRELDESSPTLPDNMYGRTKLEAEQVVRAHAERMSTVIVRISETYGPGDLRLLKLFNSIDRGVFVMIGSGSNQRQVIHVDDLARGLLTAGVHPAAVGETFIFAGTERLTTREMVRQVADALGRPAPRRRAPLGPFFAAALLLEKTLRPLGIPPPLHRRRLDFFTKSFTFATDKAERLLGFRPAIPFASGALQTADWYRRHGHLGAGVVGHRAASAPPLALAAAPVPPDVPLRVAADPAWQHSELLEYTQDAIIIWEMDGRGILFWNRAAEQLYGYSRGEALGKATHELLKTSTAGGVGKLEERLSQFGVWVGELQHTASDGRRIDVHGRLALLSQHTGRWLVLEVNRDITDLNRAAEQQQALEAQLSTLKRGAQLE